MAKIVGIIDYGMGNLFSVHKSISIMGYSPMICSTPSDIENTDVVILPGVGHFAAGMRHLKISGLDKAIIDYANNQRKPLIGICLGMQLMTEFSEEGNVEGLGLIKAQTKKFMINTGSAYRIPHMGWNSLRNSTRNPKLSWVQDLRSEFYFVHSYCVDCAEDSNVLFETEYGIRFASGIFKDNIAGVQFHPEKSHSHGLRLLKHLIEMSDV